MIEMASLALFAVAAAIGIATFFMVLVTLLAVGAGFFGYRAIRNTLIQRAEKVAMSATRQYLESAGKVASGAPERLTIPEKPDTSNIEEEKRRKK